MSVMTHKSVLIKGQQEVNVFCKIIVVEGATVACFFLLSCNDEQTTDYLVNYYFRSQNHNEKKSLVISLNS